MPSGTFIFLIGRIKMRKLWLGILATLLVVVFVAPAFAWEFSMTGEFEWRQQYFSRTGNRDLFGDANAQENTLLTSNYGVVPAVTGTATITSVGEAAFTGGAAARQAWVGFSGPNIYGTGWINPDIIVGAGTYAGQNQGRPIIGPTAPAAGVQITRGGFSRWGCDAWISDQRLTFNPVITVNKAIRVHGVYTVGGLRNKFAQRNYDAQGQVAVGAPPFERFYMHHSSDAAYNTAAIGSWEQVRATIQLPIATFSYGVKDFPFGTGMQFSYADRTDSFLAVVPYGPFRFLFAVWPGQDSLVPGLNNFDTNPDRDTRNDYRYGPLATYENGPLWLGAGGILTHKHVHPRNAVIISTVANGPGGADIMSRLWEVGFKYNNGRFFLNGDAATVMVEATRIGNTPQFAYNNKYFIEGGAMFGPTKISLMTAWASGNTANSGNVTYGNLNISDVGYPVLQPYSFLMFPTYAGGNNRFHNDGTGQMGDAYCFAGRIDYAAAANLNLFGTYIWASRVEQNGYRAGTFFATSTGTNAAYASTATPAGAYNIGTSDVKAQTLKVNQGAGWGANANPFVDDSYIGWEAQAGFDWKLLESFTMNMAYSYWQPGPWFDQAYQVFSATPMGQTGNGLMQGRDAIQSIKGALVINF